MAGKTTWNNPEGAETEDCDGRRKTEDGRQRTGDGGIHHALIVVNKCSDVKPRRWQGDARRRRRDYVFEGGVRSAETQGKPAVSCNGLATAV